MHIVVGEACTEHDHLSAALDGPALRHQRAHVHCVQVKPNEWRVRCRVLLAVQRHLYHLALAHPGHAAPKPAAQ
eukprot:2490779-Prymnesium_polylepis.1